MRLRQVPAVFALAVVAGLSSALPASAHHGGTGDYDGSRPLYLSGTVTDVRYGYPHALIRIDVPPDLTVPADLGPVEDLRGYEYWSGQPLVEAAGENRELLLPPDITGIIGTMANRPAIGDTVSAIAYQRCVEDSDHQDEDHYDGELRVQLITFGEERLAYGGSITRITDGCPEAANGSDATGRTNTADPADSAEPTDASEGREDDGTGSTAQGNDGLLERSLHALEDTSLAAAVRTQPWLYPGLEIVHIAGIAILVGAAAMFDLRLLGAARNITVPVAARQLLPWSWVGFGIVASSGLLMFAANAASLAENSALRWKLLLIMLAGVNAAVFQFGPYRNKQWQTERHSPPQVKFFALISLLVWLSIIACGRLIAYV